MNRIISSSKYMAINNKNYIGQIGNISKPFAVIRNQFSSQPCRSSLLYKVNSPGKNSYSTYNKYNNHANDEDVDVDSNTDQNYINEEIQNMQYLVEENGEFASPSMNYQLFEKIKMDESEQLQKDRSQIIYDYKQNKLANRDTQYMASDQFNSKVQNTFEEIHIAFNELIEQQNHHEQIQISKLFTGELVIGIKGVGQYQIFEDSKQQLLNLYSPKTGFYCFEYRRPQNKWININDDQFLNGCLQSEINHLRQVEGFLNY